MNVSSAFGRKKLQAVGNSSILCRRQLKMGQKRKMNATAQINKVLENRHR